MSYCNASNVLIVIKIFLYSITLVVSTYISERHFGDTYLGSLGVFVLLSTMLELLIHGGKSVFYYLAVIALIMTGFGLLQTATRVHVSHGHGTVIQNQVNSSR